MTPTPSPSCRSRRSRTAASPCLPTWVGPVLLSSVAFFKGISLRFSLPHSPNLAVWLAFPSILLCWQSLILSLPFGWLSLPLSPVSPSCTLPCSNVCSLAVLPSGCSLFCTLQTTVGVYSCLFTPCGVQVSLFRRSSPARGPSRTSSKSVLPQDPWNSAANTPLLCRQARASCKVFLECECV